MLNSKFDLYKAEWLDLVFKNRNQQYGAYEMRAHYGDVMMRAMAVTFFTVAMGAGAITFVSHLKPPVSKPIEGTIVTIAPPPVIEHPKVIEPKHEAAAPAAKLKPLVTVPIQKFIPMVAVPDPKATIDIKPIDENIAVGSEEVKGTATGTQNAPITGKNDGPGGAGTETKPNNDPQELGNLDVMPEPVGGANAWSKFLQKNLHYPAAAREEAVGGKVYLSFIIEKDGHLSDITVIRKANYGFDEEALRVLKLAPAWKPGVQNGQPVRVRYTIPINFQINE